MEFASCLHKILQQVGAGARATSPGRTGPVKLPEIPPMRREPTWAETFAAYCGAHPSIDGKTFVKLLKDHPIDLLGVRHRLVYLSAYQSLLEFVQETENTPQIEVWPLRFIPFLRP